MNKIIFVIFIFFNNLSALEFAKRICANIIQSKQLIYRNFSSFKPTVINHEHIFGPKNKNLFKDNFLVNVHHDYMCKLENAGYFNLKNKINLDSGIYYGKLQKKLPNGHKIRSFKTFFPCQWTQEKVIEKIFEAYDNYDQEIKFEFNKAIIISETNEGIKIKMVITDAGEILTAFPIIDSDDD